MEDKNQFTHKINFFSILLGLVLLFIAVMTSSCQLTGTETPPPRTETVQLILYVQPAKVPCEDLGECLVVSYQPEGELMVLDKTIDGFEFEPGYAYTLIVERTSAVGVYDIEDYPRYHLVQVLDRESALEVTPTATEEAAQDEPTPEEPVQVNTLTLEVTPTLFPSETETATPTQGPSPTPTWTPTQTQLPTSTLEPTPCNAARFIADVSIQDGTLLTPRAAFTKVWRLQNVGTCTWTSDYDLVFISGERMGGDSVKSIDVVVPPGSTMDLAVDLTAPRDEGSYRGYWRLRDGSGDLFGIGSEYETAFWVDIEVIETNRSYAFDFALSFCTAEWTSEEGDLPCPGSTNTRDGFVRLLENPELELRSENEPALWVHPNEERYGWIEGRYPAFEIEEGDHFRGWVGCLEGNQNCNLTFYLDYIDEDGVSRSLGEWVEVYDGEVTKIDIDLSDLADEDITFILGVEVNNRSVERANGFWFVPRVEQIGGGG